MYNQIIKVIKYFYDTNFIYSSFKIQLQIIIIILILFTLTSKYQNINSISLNKYKFLTLLFNKYTHFCNYYLILLNYLFNHSFFQLEFSLLHK
jgi:hypothetical protein